MDVQEEWYVHDETEEVYVAIFVQSVNYLKLEKDISIDICIGSFLSWI